MIIQPISGSTTTTQPKRTGGRVIAPLADTSSPILERKTTAQPTPQPQPKTETSKGLVSKVATETGKFIARTGVEAVNLLSSTLDFAADFLASGLERQIRNQPLVGVGSIGLKADKEARNKTADRWKTFYEEKAGQPTEKLKNFTEKLRQIEFIQPSEDWKKASTKEKLTKRLPETILNIGPGVVSSLGSFALNPA